MSGYPLRYEGRRWTLVFGTYAGVEQVAIQRLNAVVQRHVPYVVKGMPAADCVPEREERGLAHSARPMGEPTCVGVTVGKSCRSR